MAKYLDYSGLSYLWSKIQAYVGAATGSNENLFDNPWFTEGNVINSRKIAYNTTISASNYGIDRWSGVGDGYTLSATGVTATGVMVQKGNWSSIVGKTVTLSALGSDGVIGTWTGAFQAGSFTLSNNKGSGVIANTSQINIGGGGEWAALKLELGELSTLANDAPPDYGEELTRCIYSTADPTDTYANNGFGRSNPNLLDNWWFGNPINQRGLTSYSGSGQLKTIDRWILYNGSGANSLSVQSGYISVKSDSNGFAQFVEDSVGAALNGKTITCSVMFNDGSITSATGVYSNSSLVSLGSGLYVGGSGGKQVIVSYTTSTTAKNIKAMKVELGKVSTLVNDVPPDYGTELAKCQRYFVRVKGTYACAGTGVAVSTTLASIVCPLPVPMRALPTATVAGSLYLHSNADVLMTGFTPVTLSNNMLTINATVSSGLSVGYSEMAQIRDGTSYVDLSADL